MAAAQELSFTPSPLARGLMTGRTSTVGFIIGDSMSHRFAVPVMLGADVALDEIDLSMITCDARDERSVVHALLAVVDHAAARAATYAPGNVLAFR